MGKWGRVVWCEHLDLDGVHTLPTLACNCRYVWVWGRVYVQDGVTVATGQVDRTFSCSRHLTLDETLPQALEPSPTTTTTPLKGTANVPPPTSAPLSGCGLRWAGGQLASVGPNGSRHCAPVCTTVTRTATSRHFTLSRSLSLCPSSRKVTPAVGQGISLNSETTSSVNCHLTAN